MDTYVPPEVWLRIFCFATCPEPATSKLLTSTYVPFFDMITPEEDLQLQDARTTARNLISVCRQFYDLGLDVLYQRVRWSHGTQGLTQSLKGKEGTLARCGGLAKRVELAITEPEDPKSDVLNLDLCPNAQILVKTEDDLVKHPNIVKSDLTNLRRFDWWCCRFRDGVHEFGDDSDDLSWGLNFLQDIVSLAPNLQYLSVAWRNTTTRPFPFPAKQNRRIVTLPSLRTLRLETLSRKLETMLSMWECPLLDTMIVDFSVYLFDHPSPYVPNRLDIHQGIVRLELMDDEGFTDIQNTLELLSSRVPHLKELSFYVEFIFPPSKIYDPGFPLLRTLRLHSKTNRVLRYSTWSLPTAMAWTRRRLHFKLISNRKTFPCLERVILHGDWDAILADSQFHEIYEDFRQTEGLRLEFPDGRLV